LLAALAVAGSAFANPEQALDDGPRWACWYAPAALNIQCLLYQTPTRGLEQRAAEVSDRADRRLPTLARQIWGSPEKLAGARISIPLMAPPYEMSQARRLARSVVCGARKDCSVVFDRNADGHAPLRAAILESGGGEAALLAEMMASEAALADPEAPPSQNRKRRRG
jgi:hypothetical protein